MIKNKVQEEIINAIISIMARNEMTPKAGITETLNAVTRFMDVCALGLGIEEEAERTAFIKDIYKQIIDQL